jgi:AcrR family transcriptional regulator
LGIRERQERERESVRRAILDAARDLFIAEGYQNVSIRKIAERIEYSPAAIYGYFASKDDIFFALAEEGFHLLYEVAHATPTPTDPLEGLRTCLWSFHEFSKRYPEYFLLIFLDRSVPRIAEQYQHFKLLIEMKQEVADQIRRCAESGAFPASTDPMSAFRILICGLFGACATRLFNRLAPGEDGDALAHDAIELTIAALRSGVPLTFVARPMCGSMHSGEASAPPAAKLTEMPH